MSLPLQQGYLNSNQIFIDQSQSQAGPSTYAKPQPHQQQIPMHLQGPPPQTPYYGINGQIPHGYPIPTEQFQHPQHLPQQQFVAPYPPPSIVQHGQPGMVYPGMEMNGGAVVPNFHFGSMPQSGPWADEWADGAHEGQDMVYSNLEVKHRRRTTPDQLKILEYWYDINPKPDNALREHLAAQLGMTKRNVQVWFQNRRAKMKGLAKKEDKEDDEDQQKTPEKPSAITSPIQQQMNHRSMLLPPMGPPPMARRASLANGEAAQIGMFVAKRAAAAASGQNRGLRPPGFVSPQRSPLIGSAAAARRQSIPYPTPITAGPNIPNGPGPSPKISPVVRVMPSALHLTAMRNNTRRASMPGAAQLISSGPFTPPRVVTNQHQVGLPRELGTIKDDDVAHHILDSDDQQQVFLDPESDFTGNYMTPQSSAYDPSTSISPVAFLPNGAPYNPSMAFSPNAPLPNPSFSFGTEGHQQPQHHVPILDEAEAARQQQLFLAFQQRGRMGSIASINTYTTDNGNNTDLEDNGLGDWITQDLNGATGQEELDGFDPESRRSSAPADLLHQIGIMGLSNSNGMTPIRPSPLNSHFTSDDGTFEGSQFLAGGGGLSSADLDPSPVSMSSMPSSSSASVSPSENNHFQIPQGVFNNNMQHQQIPVRSVSMQQFPSSDSTGNGNSNVLNGLTSLHTSNFQQHPHSSVSPYSRHSVSPAQTNYNNYSNSQKQQQIHHNSSFDELRLGQNIINQPLTPNSGIQSGSQLQPQPQPHKQNSQESSHSHHTQSSSSSSDNKGNFNFLDDLNNDSVDITV
ncbi:uncharacterized protein L201_001864 [Kwoniella dendrophila CBS 6074]|uniref:Homeobox domain-containing protein n=1 Tax=Kwoniella dendrophila CBS 6074 TaxID=1295534 RepID=A0AAX4JR60_9TREE